MSTVSAPMVTWRRLSLQERLSPVRATIFLGVLWALWHVPILAASQRRATSSTRCRSLASPRCARRDRRLLVHLDLSLQPNPQWLAILLHGSFTAANATLFLVPSDDQVGGTYAALRTGIVFALLVVVATLVISTRGRLGFTGSRLDATSTVEPTSRIARPA